MKKSNVLAALIAAFILSLQTKAQQNFQLGIEGTPHMSWLLNQNDRDNSDFKYKNTIGSSYGISGQYLFNRNLGICLNLMYSFQGQVYTIGGIERNRKLEYYKVPLMLGYCYEFNENWLFSGKIGPQFSGLMNASLTDKDGNNIVSDQKGSYEDFDISGVVYAGVGYKITESIQADASLRFDYGFTNAEKSTSAYINDPDGNVLKGLTGDNRAVTNNMTAGITIGVRYYFGSN